MSAITLPAQRQGFALVLAAAIGFGLNPLFARLLYAEGMTPETTLLARFALPALLLAVFLPGGLRHGRRSLVAVLAGMFMALGVMTYFQALAVLPVALAVLIYFTHPLFTVLFAWLLFGVRPRGNDLSGCLLVLLGTLGMVGGGGIDSAWVGAMLASFLAPIAYALLITVLGYYLEPMPLGERFAAGIWGCFVVVLPLALWTAPPAALLPTSSEGWWIMLAMAVFASTLPQYLFTRGVASAGPVPTAIAGSAELVVGLASGWFILAEAVQTGQVVGGLLIGVALLLASWPRTEPQG